MLAIQNDLYPNHLGKEFGVVYNGLFNERKSYSKKTHFAENYAIKIALNGVYGKSQSEYSFLYDKLYTYQTTVNGQLSLMMLIERILLLSDKITCIQSNTDGATFRFPKKYEDKINNICRYWEKHTKLELEEADYTKMFVKDVNNYSSVYSDGSVKLKGCFEIDKDFHKNSSNRIVPIAIANYIVNNVSIKNTVINHMNGNDYTIGNQVIKNKGIFDFCIGLKASVSNYTLIEEGESNKVLKDKVLRFYIANTKKKLLKNFTSGKSLGKTQATIKGWNVEMFMDYIKKEDYNIQYLYYIEECRKIIDPVIKPSNNAKTEQFKLF